MGPGRQGRGHHAETRRRREGRGLGDVGASSLGKHAPPPTNKCAASHPVQRSSRRGVWARGACGAAVARGANVGGKRRLGFVRPGAFFADHAHVVDARPRISKRGGGEGARRSQAAEGGKRARGCLSVESKSIKHRIKQIKIDRSTTHRSSAAQQTQPPRFLPTPSRALESQFSVFAPSSRNGAKRKCVRQNGPQKKCVDPRAPFLSGVRSIETD